MIGFSSKGLLFAPLVFITAAGCAVDATHDAQNEESTGTTSQALAGWTTAAWGTTADFVGLDTNISVTNWACVLSGVTGNLNAGGSMTPGLAIQSKAVIDPYYGQYNIFAHGGTTASGDPLNNPVFASTACFPHPRFTSSTWVSTYGSVAMPRHLAPLNPVAPSTAQRRCFLTGIQSGVLGWLSVNNFARVRRVTTTDATHPTTGWYIESNLVSNSGGHARVYATCVDFPTIAGEWDGAFGGNTFTLTSGAGVKACGLTAIHGDFSVNDFNNGVKINAPATASGNWSMTVSPNKFAVANCIQ